jgi:NADH:ubiquinone oxidoreductase subunit H
MNSLIPDWQRTLGLPSGLPQWFIVTLALFSIFVFIIVPSTAFLVYIERKFGADLQARVGPNRAGPAGILQPLVDLLKLLEKDTDHYPSRREEFWLGVQAMALYSTVAVIPLGSTVLLVNTDMSAFMPFLAVLVLGLGTMLLGLSQGAVPGWFGGLRMAGQTLAGAFPAMVTLLCVGVRAGGFRWSTIASSQGASPFSWAIFSDPFQFFAFAVFVVSGLVLLSVPPFEGGLSVSDIHGGVAAHLHGRFYSLFRMGRSYGFFLWCVIAAVLFLGAWNLPPSISKMLLDSEAFHLIQALELGVLLMKTFALMLIVIWVARVNPRVRADQITDLSWKILSPLSLVALTGTAIWMGWRVLS